VIIKKAMSEEKNLLKRGRFYFIYDDDPQNFVVEDKTKMGLPVLESNIDENAGIKADNGRFYDANGRGHVVPIRWYFAKEKYTLDQVYNFTDKLENRYRVIMEDTCPDY
jgi:hypothetical protein